MDGLAFLHQRVEYFRSFGLGLGERAQSCQPDLLRRVAHGFRQLFVAGIVGDCFQFSDHDPVPFG